MTIKEGSSRSNCPRAAQSNCATRRTSGCGVRGPGAGNGWRTGDRIEDGGAAGAREPMQVPVGHRRHPFPGQIVAVGRRCRGEIRRSVDICRLPLAENERVDRELMLWLSVAVIEFRLNSDPTMLGPIDWLARRSGRVLQHPIGQHGVADPVEQRARLGVVRPRAGQWNGRCLHRSPD